MSFQAHDPLRHIAVQILQFSLSFESEPLGVKKVLLEALRARPDVKMAAESYAAEKGFRNLDHLLEHLVFESPFSALVIIDSMPDELEGVLSQKFRFGASTTVRINSRTRTPSITSASDKLRQPLLPAQRRSGMVLALDSKDGMCSWSTWGWIENFLVPTCAKEFAKTVKTFLWAYAIVSKSQGQDRNVSRFGPLEFGG